MVWRGGRSSVRGCADGAGSPPISPPRLGPGMGHPWRGGSPRYGTVAVSRRSTNILRAYYAFSIYAFRARVRQCERGSRALARVKVYRFLARIELAHVARHDIAAALCKFRSGPMRSRGPSVLHPPLTPGWKGLMDAQRRIDDAYMYTYAITSALCIQRETPRAAAKSAKKSLIIY